MERSSTKVSIQHPNASDCRLVGILEQIASDQPTQGRKLALILHGTLGHKDYLFQKALSNKLPLDSFRFDFRGNNESGGVWKQGALHEDFEDLQAVVAYLKSGYGYVIDLVVGHSRGAIAGFHWIAASEDGRKASAFVNVSGRYRMERIVESDGVKLWLEAFKKQGFYEWEASVARKKIRVTVTPDDLKSFVNWDTSFVWTQFPSHTHVLSVHGLQDRVVPPYDAVIYTHALGNRSPGTATLHYVETADHNFTGQKDVVVDAILRWLEDKERGVLKPVGVSLGEGHKAYL
ncbi:alpha/beta-hydrolase [Coprinopsis marcescibilis]|uniref:Alpha/beta-hydrolase n=1 Tax=Coprinopsis marcescibilis TaxID=230819 RepID=A0A5C3KJX0_COPMA|nr:alpha/beta-hydrolase [Coprinopsis marcescibilis]